MVKRKKFSILSSLFPFIKEKPETPAEKIKVLEEMLKRYRGFIDSFPDPVVILDKHGRFIEFNKGAESISGYKREEIIGKHFAQARIIATESIPKVLSEFAKRMLGIKSKPYAVMGMSKKGARLPIELHATQIKDDGRIVGDLIVVRDISERKLAEDKLKEAYRRLEKVDELKDTFIRDISHELKTPLAVMIGGIGLLRKTNRNDLKKQKELLSLLERNTKRLRGSIGDILLLSRIGTGKEYAKENVNIVDLLDDSTDLFRPLAKMKGLYIRNKIEGKLPKIKAEEALLSTAINNIISNAVKFTEEGGITITARKANGKIEIKVKDTGVGISKEHKEKIFEKFFKGSPDTPGTGLGLAISKEVIEGHGGTITCKSKLGKGSTFKILLPIKGGR